MMLTKEKFAETLPIIKKQEHVDEVGEKFKFQLRQPQRDRECFEYSILIFPEGRGNRSVGPRHITDCLEV